MRVTSVNSQTDRFDLPSAMNDKQTHIRFSIPSRVTTLGSLHTDALVLLSLFILFPPHLITVFSPA